MNDMPRDFSKQVSDGVRVSWIRRRAERATVMNKEEFKQARITLGFSQSKLAKALGRNVRTIQRYESGDWVVSQEVIKLLQEIGEG